MKLVREHINEKFELDSDPIKDMGIGFGAEFGDIIRCKLNAYTNRKPGEDAIYALTNKDGNHTGIFLPDWYGIVLSVSFESGILVLKVHAYSENIEYARILQSNVKANKYTPNIAFITGSVQQFNKYFEIIK